MEIYSYPFWSTGFLNNYSKKNDIFIIKNEEQKLFNVLFGYAKKISAWDLWYFCNETLLWNWFFFHIWGYI